MPKRVCWLWEAGLRDEIRWWKSIITVVMEWENEVSAEQHPCSVNFGLYQAIKLNLRKIWRARNTLTDKWTDKHMEGQAAKQPNKHATTLLLITLWPQRQSTSSAADLLSPFFPPLDVTWITTSRLPSAPWGSAALPLERLYVIKNETAKQKKNRGK